MTGSGLLATGALVAELATPAEMLAYLGLGTLASLLPDLDSDNSAPVQIGFTVLAVSVAFSVMFVLADTFTSAAELLAVWLTAYLLLRWLAFALFTRLTTHRGMFHSLPAAVLSGLLTAVVAADLLGMPPPRAWLAAMFVCFGYLLHLFLDELYSVNLFGMRTRRSFGSALKLWSPSSRAAGVYLYVACLAAFSLTPEYDSFLRTLSSPETRVRIHERMFPVDGWFRPVRTPARGAG